MSIMNLKVGDKVKVVNKNFKDIKNPVVVDFTEDLVFIEFIASNGSSSMRLSVSDVVKV